ncbi:hypothetical protein CDAR_365621 [Caerostris darwini]|uniref:Uncharacterized protein n=1 Tax=Caerostris darwini TaxID=1538125 RepID=A0AAV4RGR8_9ARAC|nr:hypothetical protein CDAR_365621 [Caerostris darwini]
MQMGSSPCDRGGYEMEPIALCISEKRGSTCILLRGQILLFNALFSNQLMYWEKVDRDYGVKYMLHLGNDNNEHELSDRVVYNCDLQRRSTSGWTGVEEGKGM